MTTLGLSNPSWQQPAPALKRGATTAVPDSTKSTVHATGDQSVAQTFFSVLRREYIVCPAASFSHPSCGELESTREATHSSVLEGQRTFTTSPSREIKQGSRKTKHCPGCCWTSYPHRIWHKRAYFFVQRQHRRSGIRSSSVPRVRVCVCAPSFLPQRETRKTRDGTGLGSSWRWIGREGNTKNETVRYTPGE